ncbi:hypothetical protein [Clostridium sp. AM58-1XD]|uniref:hypothetical protein n=1 Tax=Clostridium sp. AM58-1XD TaxID=2292307 RepID=UPI000E540FC9|nr:hypothetical protein [Clostridium sp. AM58-1XD]RGZ01509.1 hypothetical protein DXA13_01310 [Clostridium sp. AM58-1XD]
MKYRITEDDSEVILRGFLVRDWLDALTSPSPADLLKGNFNSVSGMKGNTTGTLTRSSTDIGDWHIRDNEKIPDAILEMRQLKNNVQPGEWRDLAEKVVLLVTTANDISGISSGSPVSDSAPPLVPAVPGRRSKAIPDRVKSFIIPPAEGYTKAIYSNESPEHVLKLARSNKELFCSHLIKIDKCKKTLTKYQTDANSASKYNDIKPSITGFNSAVSTLKGLLNNEKYRNISILAHQYIANQGLPGADQDPEELLSKFKEYRINYIDRDKTLDGYRKSFFDTIHQKADSEVTSFTKSLSDIRTQKNNHEKKITSDSQQLKDTTAHLTERNNASTLLTGLNRKLTNYKKEYEKLSAQQAALQSEYGTLRARFETPPAQKGTSLLSKKSAVISKPVKGKPGSHPVPIAAAPKPSAPVPSNPAPTPAVLTPAQKKQLTDLQKQIDTISEKLAANYTGQQALQREYDRISGDTTDQDMLQSQIKILTDGIAACRKQLSDLKTKEKSQEAELAKWEKLLKKYS